ncbi:hypothetical protein [Burkholderia mayonis]|uniref:hypothetical protein n=1 Tax=Burkholderia mayonis TaxID=1385591 RepID=UPI001CF79F97|nr:hypothetical protein [Burkholderia mayonis]
MLAREPRTANREPRTANREPRTANREPRTASRKPQAASRKPQAVCVALVTTDAHALYRPVGFTAPAHPDRWMKLHRPDVYAQPQPGAR